MITPAATGDLDALIVSHSLPANSVSRVRRSLAPLARFLNLGAALDGRWHGLRFVIGPWRWLILVYTYDVRRDTVFVVTIQDGRTPTSLVGSGDR